MAKGKTEAAAETTQRERWEFNKTKLSEGYEERQIHNLNLSHIILRALKSN